ncbi:immunoglobulin superfamily member 11-like [Emydura macquarii macquarii]|uniref:immunoglobulin superfamily member 11-like n=1 Tax=Emydura macquarii macquarii TaxID=1129001 RepID=UPI00352B902E
MAPREKARPHGHPVAPAGLWLLHCYLSAAGAVKVSVGAASIQVARGGNALLPCAFHTTASLNRLNIIWTVTPLAEPDRPQQVLAYEQGEVVESLSQYTGRVGFAFPPTRSATIFLNETRSSDSGTYQCSVMNPPDRDTPNIGVIQLTVLVPPSGPECSSVGSGEEGGDVHLVCAVREGVPTPTLRWEKIPPNNQPLVMSYTEARRARLTLPNVTADTSGLYRCTASNPLGSRFCTLQLHVRLAPQGTLSIVVGVTVTMTMGLVLLALLALVLWLHHQSVRKWPEEEEEDSYNEIRVDSISPGRLIVAKTLSGDIPLANRAAKPLWVFAGSTPTSANRQRGPGDGSQAAPPGEPSQPAWAAPRGRRKSSSLCEEGALPGSESEEEPAWQPSCHREPALAVALPTKHPGFLV